MYEHDYNHNRMIIVLGNYVKVGLHFFWFVKKFFVVLEASKKVINLYNFSGKYGKLLIFLNRTGNFSKTLFELKILIIRNMHSKRNFVKSNTKLCVKTRF